MKISSGSRSPVANAAILVGQSLNGPWEPTTIEFDGQSQSPKQEPIVATPVLQWAIFCFFLVTVASGLAEIWMASVWVTPTPMQQSAFDIIGYGWKSGLPALLGLVGGKMIK
jgi:hypothetical protein